MSTWHVTWQKGGNASFVHVEGEHVTLRSTIPSPPGSRLEGTLLVPPAGPINVKVHGSKKEADGTFTVRGRFVDATREIRDLLAALAASEAAR